MTKKNNGEKNIFRQGPENLESYFAFRYTNLVTVKTLQDIFNERLVSFQYYLVCVI